MTRSVLIVEGDPPEIALALKRGTGATGAERCREALLAAAAGLAARVARPFFSDHDPAAFDPGAFRGVIVQGSSAAVAPDGVEAAPVRALIERSFAAGTPVYGSGWGAALGAVVLGGGVGDATRSPGVARALRVVGAGAMTEGRRLIFDAISAPVASPVPPASATATVAGDDRRIWAFTQEEDGVDFWGAVHRCDASLADASFWAFSHDPRAAEAMRLASRDPVAHARLAAKHRIGLDLLDAAYRRTELANWARSKLGAV